MSVIVKGIEMPKNCYYDCPFEENGWCLAVDGIRKVESIDRPDWCPLEEAKPVRHGRWKTDSDGYLVCSECEAVALQRAWISDEYEGIRFEKSPYCPNCGAAMDKVEREEGLL